MRVLGPAGYGAVAVSQGLIGYLALVVDYGFTLSASRRIAVEREDVEAVSRTAAEVWAAKALLCLAGLALLGLAGYVVPPVREVRGLCLALYGTVAGNVLSPLWAFQGMERLVPVSLVNLAGRGLIVLATFGFVRRPGDVLVYALIVGGTYLATGLAGMLLAFTSLALRPVWPSWKGVGRAFREGGACFAAAASGSLLTAGNPFIVGLLAGHAAAGHYSLAEKVAFAAAGLLWPLSQAAYPRSSRLASRSELQAAYRGWRAKVLAVMGAAGAVLFGFLLGGASVIATVLAGPSAAPVAAALRVLAPVALLSAFTNAFGVQGMLASGQERALTVTLLAAGALNLALGLVLVPRWGEIGMAAAVVAGLALAAAVQAWYVCRGGNARAYSLSG
jgi:PST family polysaccharide transporter